jgi:CSLREA domain-containing protein
LPARIDAFTPAWRQLICVTVLAAGLLGLTGNAFATFYQVNSPADVPDANTATAACETAAGNGICTLRAAVQQANAHAGADTILVPAGTYALSRPGSDDTALNGDLDVTDNLTIIGAGAGSTVINGSASGDRVFEFIGAIKVNVYNLTIEDGHGSGGGIGMVNGADALIDGCAISGNAGDTGSGVYNVSTGSLTLKNSIVSNNVNTVMGVIGGSGGGLASFGPVSISNSTFSGNAAGLGGGLFLLATPSDSTITNTTFSGNSAADQGGAIYVSASTVRLYNSTVAENAANVDKENGGTGGGIYSVNSNVTLTNSILAGNYQFIDNSQDTILADCAGTLGTAGGNIVTSPSCTINGAYTSDDPRLGPLQDNGGPTPTHALLPGSPAVEAGGACFDPLGAPLRTDQRGIARPQGAFCDLGAFELEDVVFVDDFETHP